MQNKDAYMLAGAVALTDSAVKSFIKEPPVKNYGFTGNKFDKYPKAVAYVSAVLTGAVVVAMAYAPEKLKLPMALILGGALSNSADRLVRGYVVDYIPMASIGSSKGKKYYGNISDLAIFIGAGFGTVRYLFEGKSKQHEPVHVK